MTICRLLECINNDRLNDPRCTLSEIEVDTRKQCMNFKTDFTYLTEQFRNRHVVTSRHLEARSFENLVHFYEKKLRLIMRGGLPSRILVRSERDTLRNYEILKMNGRCLEISSQALAILESNALEGAAEGA